MSFKSACGYRVFLSHAIAHPRARSPVHELLKIYTDNGGDLRTIPIPMLTDLVISERFDSDRSRPLIPVGLSVFRRESTIRRRSL